MYYSFYEVTFLQLPLLISSDFFKLLKVLTWELLEPKRAEET